jgi:L,D-transpeptidase YcbB
LPCLQLPGRVIPLVALLVVPAPAAPQQPSATTIRELVRERVEVFRAVGDMSAGGRAVLARTALPRFYEERAFEPVWVAPAPAARLRELTSAIRTSEEHGLDPEAYHLTTIDSLARRLTERFDEETAVDLELLATDAFLVLGSHLLHGRVNPETINPEWLANRRSARLDTILAQAVERSRIVDGLYELAPQQERYRRMLAAARTLRTLAARGGWPVVPDGERLEVGSEGPRVLALRRRLGIGGDVASAEDDGRAEPLRFDPSLAEAVRRFQRRHGLDADGVVGRATLAALNVPAQERLRQIEINLERWRWLPAELGDRHIEVNIPGFDVRVVEDGTVVARHRAVVGRRFRATPMFTGSMTYLVLAPYWHVPPTIAAVDKLPLIKQDPGQIARDRMTLLELGTDTPVDPSTVDWASMTGADFNRRYRLRQDPGPFNALGHVKFMFPNRHNVYLHDTPSRDLFERTARDFSSGCIRVDRALELAEYLLRDRPGWTRERIEEVARGRVERTVPLGAALPVHLLYWTAWADDDVTLHFRDDIYGRDDVVWRALTAPPPVD